jgi:hypothetical protein
MDLAVGCQSLNVPATETVLAVGSVYSKLTDTSCGLALWLRPWSWLCFIDGDSAGRLTPLLEERPFPFATMHRKTSRAPWGVTLLNDFINFADFAGFRKTNFAPMEANGILLMIHPDWV